MDFETLKLIENEAERTAATYEIFNEDSRLNRSKAARVEFITTVRAIESVLKPGARILDIGAGAGPATGVQAVRARNRMARGAMRMARFYAVGP